MYDVKRLSRTDVKNRKKTKPIDDNKSKGDSNESNPFDTIDSAILAQRLAQANFVAVRFDRR